MNTVYIELLLLDNLAVNFIIIFFTGRIAKAYAKIYRVLLGALVGGIYAVLALAVWPVLQSLPFKIAASLAMALAAFGFGNLRQFLTRVFLLYTAAMAAGGMVLAVGYLFPGGGIGVRGGAVRYTLIGLVLACLLLEWLGRYASRRHMGETEAQITAAILEERVTLTAFIDTGNTLLDRVTGEGVVIADGSAVLAQLSFAQQIQDCDETVLRKLKVRYIPFETIGGSGVLTAIRPDSMTIHIRGEDFETGAYLALTGKDIFDGYGAILGPNVRLKRRNRTCLF